MPRDPMPQEEDVPMPPHSPTPFDKQQTMPMEVEDKEEEEELAEEEDMLIEPCSVWPKVSGCKFVTPSFLIYKSVGSGQHLGQL